MSHDDQTRAESPRAGAQAAAPPERDFVLLAAGDVVSGKFRIERLLDRGGMGAVYAATHLQLGNRLALKVMLPSVAGDPGAVQRFLNEARAAAHIGGEHVVRVVDVGTLDGGAPFLAMELLEGEDLSRLLQRRGPLPIEEAVDLVLEALEGIAQAHALGIVHRDLKPSNLFLAQRIDGTRCVKVLDFGISKIEGPVRAPGEPSTVTGVALGSPEYMAPEQLRDSKSVDPRADLWAVGTILYRLLSAAFPFERASLPELVVAISSDEPEPLRARRAEVPVALEGVVMRCLSRDVGARWRDAAALAEALAPFGSKAGRDSARRVAQVLAREATIRSLPPPRGRRVLPAVAAVVAAGAVAAAIVAIRSRPAPAAKVATSAAPSAAASTPAPAATALTDLPAYGTSNEEAIRAFKEGMAERRAGRRRSSRELLRKAAALDPSFPAARVELAVGAARHAGSADRADYVAADQLRGRLTPRDATLLDAIAPLVLSVPSDFRGGEDRLRRAAERFPRDVEIAKELAWVVLSRSATDSAAEAERAVELDPLDASANGALIDAQLYAGLRAQARASVDRCLQALPRAMNCLFMAADMADEEGRCSDMETAARRMMLVDPDFVISRAMLTSALAQNGSPEGAREVLASMPREYSRRFRSENMPNEAQVRFLEGDFGSAGVLAREASAAVAESDERDARAGPIQALVQLAVEMGKLDEAAKLAAGFLDRSEAWEPDPGADDFALMADPTPELLGALRLAGRIGAGELAERRGRWLAKWPKRADSAPYLWAHGYGDVSLVDEDAGDASAALAAMRDFPRPVEYFAAGLPAAGIGVTYARAGRFADALPWLERAAKACRAAVDPFEQTRALYWLGRAREQTGDRAGACAAYDGVLARWGKAKPRSVTADAARGREGALACETR